MEIEQTGNLFSPESFGIFQRRNWKDMLFNKQRLEVKESLKKLGTLLEEKLPFLSENLTMELGTETPALWNNRQVDRLELFHLRRTDERMLLNKAFGREIPMSLLLQAPSPLYAHASLGIIVSESGLEVGLRVPFLAIGDIAVFRKVLEGDQVDIIDALRALPAHLVITTPTGEKRLVNSVTREELLSGLDALDSAGNREHRSCLSIVHHMPPAQYTLTDDGFISSLASIYTALIPLYAKLTWSAELDQLDVRGLIASQEQVLKRERQEREEAQIAAKEAAQREQQDAQKRVEEERAERMRRDRKEAAQKPAVKEPPRKRMPSPERQPAPREARPPRPRKEKADHVPPKRQSGPAKAPVSSYTAGDEVVINAGLLAGKRGVVKGQGSAKFHYLVQVGAMVVNVDAKDLKPAS